MPFRSETRKRSNDSPLAWAALHKQFGTSRRLNPFSSLFQGWCLDKERIWFERNRINRNSFRWLFSKVRSEA
jgi:hypothetical protein